MKVNISLTNPHVYYFQWLVYELGMNSVREAVHYLEFDLEGGSCWCLLIMLEGFSDGTAPVQARYGVVMCSRGESDTKAASVAGGVVEWLVWLPVTVWV